MVAKKSNQKKTTIICYIPEDFRKELSTHKGIQSLSMFVYSILNEWLINKGKQIQKEYEKSLG
jgi:hypothetical protein